MSKKSKTQSYMVSMSDRRWCFPIEAKGYLDALKVIDAIRLGAETANGELPSGVELWERTGAEEATRVFPLAVDCCPVTMDFDWPRPFEPSKEFRFVVCTSTTTGGVVISRHKDAAAAKSAAARATIGRTDPVIWGEMSNPPKPGAPLSGAQLCDILTPDEMEPTPPTSRSYIPELPAGENEP